MRQQKVLRVLIQEVALKSIISDLEAMGLKTPSPTPALSPRMEDKLYQVETDKMIEEEKL